MRWPAAGRRSRRSRATWCRAGCGRPGCASGSPDAASVEVGRRPSCRRTVRPGCHCAQIRSTLQWSRKNNGSPAAVAGQRMQPEKLTWAAPCGLPSRIVAEAGPVVAAVRDVPVGVVDVDPRGRLREGVAVQHGLARSVASPATPADRRTGDAGRAHGRPLIVHVCNGLAADSLGGGPPKSEGCAGRGADEVGVRRAAGRRSVEAPVGERYSTGRSSWSSRSRSSR